MKKLYTNPMASMLLLDAQDIIRTSIMQEELFDFSEDVHVVDWSELK